MNAIEKSDLKKLYNVLFLAVAIFLSIGNISFVSLIISNIVELLSPFLFGGLLAFLINIPMNAIEKRMVTSNRKIISSNKISRAFALLFSLIFVIFIFFEIFTLIVPEIANVIKLLIQNIPYYSEKIDSFLESSDSIGLFLKDSLTSLKLNEDTLKEEFIKLLSNMLASSITMIKTTFSIIFNLVISIVFSIYILISKEKLLKQLDKFLKAYLNSKAYTTIIKISKLSQKIFSTFFTVQCFEATLLGLLCVLGMLILKIPYAITVGIFVGVTALIPVVGAFIGIIVGAILIVSVEPVKVLTFIIFVLILQQVETNLIYPKVVGDLIGLPGIWVLVAISIGGNLLGIAGMLISVPLATVVYMLLREDVNNRLKNKN